jgi:uncharacterized membrane protein
MTRLTSLAYNIAFFLNCLLVFFIFFESQLVIPGWLEISGRLHPLVLHFPIVLLLLYCFWVLLVTKNSKVLWVSGLADNLLLLGTLTAVLSALTGFILSKESGYEADSLVWHKWMGIGTAWLSLGWYSARNYFEPERVYSKGAAVVTALMVFIAGHQGGNITHGDDFISLSGSNQEIARTVALADAVIYADLVHPILEQKCVSCHNTKKAKGELSMETAELLAKGGKSGILWDTTRSDLGLLLQRVHLPADDKKHMPPIGKTQLTEEELLVIASWISGGSSFTQKVAELPAEHPIYRYAERKLGGSEQEERYEFPSADADLFKKLNTNYRIITPVALESPALAVNFYNRESFKSKDIEDLLDLKNQIVSIDLSKMPVKDEDLKVIGKFTQLRQLLLNFTDIKGSGLSDLKNLPNLRRLSLTGTAVDYKQVEQVVSFPALTHLFIWNTNLQSQQLALLRKRNSKIVLEGGYRGDSITLKLNTPQILNEEAIVQDTARLRIKHQIPGTTIRYTLDGTMPDSVNSPVYKEPVSIQDNSMLRARAFRTGWYGSDVVERAFFKAGFPIDSVALLTLPAPAYRSKEGKTLFDGIKSDDEFRNGKWLGYRENNMDALIFMKKPVQANSVTLSMVWNIGGYIFPPKKIEVFGGMEKDKLQLLGTITPEMPTKDSPNRKLLLYKADFSKQEIKYIRIKAYTSGKLPDWHPGKGDITWIFMDEVFVN